MSIQRLQYVVLATLMVALLLVFLQLLNLGQRSHAEVLQQLEQLQVEQPMPRRCTP